MWMDCFAGDARIEGNSAEQIEDRFVAHATEIHDWSYPEQALRNYARNFVDATVRLTGPTARLDEIGEVAIHPVSEERIDDWINFFDHDAFADNPDWASCYCLVPHVPPTEDDPERPWREVRAAMIKRLRAGGTFGYLAYVDGKVAGWVNASLRSEYGLFRLVDPEGPDPASVVGVSCFVVAPPYRRHGIAARLLERVVVDAAERGADWIEAYPRNDAEGGDPENFRGPRRLFERLGFEPVLDRDRDTVMRRGVVSE